MAVFFVAHVGLVSTRGWLTETAQLSDANRSDPGDFKNGLTN